MKNAMLAMIAGLLLLSVPQKAEAALITWSGNGHSYDYVLTSSATTWDAARLDALSKGGYLATLTSPDENNFVWSSFQGQITGKTVLLGGSQTAGSAEPSAGWNWVNGEGPFTFTNWYSSEPNNSGGNENYLAFSWNGANGTWNDIPATLPSGNTWSTTGYIIEHNAVPEPATMVLLGIGLAGMGMFRRKNSAA